MKAKQVYCQYTVELANGARFWRVLTKCPADIDPDKLTFEASFDHRDGVAHLAFTHQDGIDLKQYAPSLWEHRTDIRYLTRFLPVDDEETDHE